MTAVSIAAKGFIRDCQECVKFPPSQIDMKADAVLRPESEIVIYL